MEIYLDHAATGVMRPESVAAYCSAAACGNPSSLHSKGIEAKRLLESSRRSVASAFGCLPEEIFFTSGGSEGNNTAIFGLARLRAKRAKRIILSEGEHPSVENPVKELVSQGFEAKYIPTSGGRLDLDSLREALSVPTALVCIMLANNETGALYDIAGVRRAIDSSGSGAFFHCDAVQGFLKTPDSAKLKRYCDTASVSAHKVGGPKGVGALFVKSGVKIPPLIYGGGQERGLRSGTEDLPGAAAFAAACEAHTARENEYIASLREYTVKLLSDPQDGIVIRTPERFVPSILSISVPGVRSEVMLNALSAEGICVSAGSACSAARKGSSRVLEAYGMPKKESESALRLSFGVTNTEEECAAAAQAIVSAARRLRR